MQLWKWGKDRFNTGYKIFTIAYIQGIFDCYLFKYELGSHIPKHKDPAKYGKQYRFNIIIKNAKQGGKFWCKGKHINICNIFFAFRADSCYHGVTHITEGNRVVLSFGIYIK